MRTLLVLKASSQDVRELFTGAKSSHCVFASLDLAPFPETERHVRKSEAVVASPWTVSVWPSSPPQGGVL